MITMRFLLITALIVGFMLPARAQPHVSVTFDTFHVGLASHGAWLTVGAYGKVWRPRGVAADWRPYYRGQWVWTDDGWLWDSDEPWGWATYHYGRWAYEPAYGWLWIPGYKWAPSWVEWRSGDEDIGWAPMPPEVHVTVVPKKSWVFVPYKRFVGVPVHRVAYHHRKTSRYWRRTRPIHVHAASPLHRGPERRYVERRMGRPVHVVRTVEIETPDRYYRHSRRHERRHEVRVFRPRVHRPAPSPRHKVVRPPHRHEVVKPLPRHKVVRPPHRHEVVKPPPRHKVVRPPHRHEVVKPPHRDVHIINRSRAYERPVHRPERSHQPVHRVSQRGHRRIEDRDRDRVQRVHEVSPARH